MSSGRNMEALVCRQASLSCKNVTLDPIGIWSGRSAHRQFNVEPASAIHVGDRDRPRVRLNDATGNRESKSRPGVTCALGFSSPTDLEDPCQLVVGDASAAVGDGEPSPTLGCPSCADQNLPVLAGVADGVADEIGQRAG